MKRKEIEEKLERFARMLGSYIASNTNYFRCWHHEAVDRFKMDDNLYYVLTKTEEFEELNDVSVLFSVNKKTYLFRLFAERYPDDVFIIYKNDNLLKMTESDVHLMIHEFGVIMQPWFDEIEEIKKLENSKKSHIKIMNGIIKNVFRWE